MRSRALLDYMEFIKINGRLFVAVALSIAALVALQFHTSDQKKECMGVVDLKETNVSFDTSVVVKNIFVLPGQRVKKGQALLEVKPVETTMKILEVKTELDQLKKERQIRDSMLSSLGKKAGDSPIDLQIQGLETQLMELQMSMNDAVRYAPSDGVVGSVNFRISEQVSPFTPVLTLNSSNPNLVYGFIHEDRLSDFQNGEVITVQSLNRKLKQAEGRVVSLGHRITEFPERLTGNPNVKFWGREIVVSLPLKNEFLPGEKVRLTSLENKQSTSFIHLVEALAGNSQEDTPKVVAYNLPFEASGLHFISGSDEDQLISVSDDLNAGSGSPFWRIQLSEKAGENFSPLPVSSLLGEKDDLESISLDGDIYYAMGSMSSGKKGHRIVSFQYRDNRLEVLKVVPLREALIQALMQTDVLRPLHSQIRRDIEIEGFSVKSGKAVIALKKPQLIDGSTLLISLDNLSEFMAENGEIPLKTSILTPLQLSSEACSGKIKVTDLNHTSSGLLILTNCSQSLVSQIWLLRSDPSMTYPTLIKTLNIPNLEGLVVSSDGTTVFLSDDNGKKGFSSVFKIQIAKYR